MFSIRGLVYLIFALTLSLMMLAALQYRVSSVQDTALVELYATSNQMTRDVYGLVEVSHDLVRSSPRAIRQWRSYERSLLEQVGQLHDSVHRVPDLNLDYKLRSFTAALEQLHKLCSKIATRQGQVAGEPLSEDMQKLLHNQLLTEAKLLSEGINLLSSELLALQNNAHAESKSGLFMILVGVFVFALLVILLVESVVLRKLSLLQDAATRVSAGDMSPRLPGSIGTEIQSAFGSFNKMVSDLDMSQRQTAAYHEKMKTALDQLSLAADIAGVGIWECCLDSDEMQWDEQLKAMYGLPATSAVDRQLWASFWHEDDREAVAAGLLACVASGKPWRGEFRICLAEGDIKYLSANAVLISGVDGTPARLLGTNTDVTDLRRLEQSANAMRAKAEAANRAKSEFLANMSHEIRTPMNGIMGLTDLALNTKLDEQQRNYLEKVRNSSSALLNILNDILDFSKIEANKLEISPVDFNIDEILYNIDGLFSVKANAKGIRLVLNSTKKLHKHYTADAMRITQVLNNLVSNAIKFTDRGTVTVGVEEELIGNNRVRITFEVQDTGIGMSREHLHELFQAFSQADTSITRRYGGTGLGLVISQRLVELMGGCIEVESGLNKGSIFRFQVIAELATPVQRRVVNTLPDMRVLVVDDNEESLFILQSFLEDRGLRVTTCISGIDALLSIEEAEAHRLPFDLALIDWQMPSMDGLELAANIQKINARSEHYIDLIIITAFDISSVKKAAHNIDIKGFLQKPFATDKLIDLLIEVGRSRVNPTPPVSLSDIRLSLSEIQGSRILLVEDNAINQLLAVDLLTELGMKVSTANNGKEAIELFSSDYFDTILMDIQMPVMDGLEATRHIRTLPGGADIPIIAMSAAAMLTDQEKCRAAGMDSHIAKPVDIKALAAELEARIKRPFNPAANDR